MLDTIDNSKDKITNPTTPPPIPSSSCDSGASLSNRGVYGIRGISNSQGTPDTHGTHGRHGTCSAPNTSDTHDTSNTCDTSSKAPEGTHYPECGQHCRTLLPSRAVPLPSPSLWSQPEKEGCGWGNMEVYKTTLLWAAQQNLHK